MSKPGPSLTSALPQRMLKLLTLYRSGTLFGWASSLLNLAILMVNAHDPGRASLPPLLFLLTSLALVYLCQSGIQQIRGEIDELLSRLHR